jgi:hypothetical protein
MHIFCRVKQILAICLAEFRLSRGNEIRLRRETTSKWLGLSGRVRAAVKPGLMLGRKEYMVRMTLTVELGWPFFLWFRESAKEAPTHKTGDYK